MISDNVLREAAIEAGETLMNSIPPEEQYRHDFSRNYERKMARMLRRTKHPYFYQSLNRAAGILLALALTGTVWLSVDVQAREALFGWLRETYATFFVYWYVGEKPKENNDINYRPANLPANWVEIDQWTEKMNTTIVYVDGDGRLNYFTYMDFDSGPIAVVETEVPITTTVGGKLAEYYPSNEENESNTLVWSEQGMVFVLSTYLTQEQMIFIAENVEQEK